MNAPGLIEIPALVFEELLVNALVHRDYLINAPIRLFIFDDRIEIVSPGHLPNHLTVAKIRVGNSIIRNPILASFVAKGVLPYRGLGTGVRRALEAWPEVEFINDPDAALLTATVLRPPLGEMVPGSVKTTPSSVETASGSVEPALADTPQRILAHFKANPETSVPVVAFALGLSTRAIEKQIARLERAGRLRHVGPRKGGRWEVLG